MKLSPCRERDLEIWPVKNSLEFRLLHLPKKGVVNKRNGRFRRTIRAHEPADSRRETCCDEENRSATGLES